MTRLHGIWGSFPNAHNLLDEPGWLIGCQVLSEAGLIEPGVGSQPVARVQWVAHSRGKVDRRMGKGAESRVAGQVGEGDQRSTWGSCGANLYHACQKRLAATGLKFSFWTSSGRIWQLQASPREGSLAPGMLNLPPMSQIQPEEPCHQVHRSKNVVAEECWQQLLLPCCQIFGPKRRSTGWIAY